MLYKRIVSLFLCFVITFSLSGVAFAEDYINRPVGFYDYLQRLVVNWGNTTPFFPIFNSLLSVTAEQICDISSDGYHHSDSIKGAHIGEDEHGQYADALCKYCDRPFKVYSSDLSAAYDDYSQDVKDKTGTTTLIDGGVRIYFNVSDIKPPVDDGFIFSSKTLGSRFGAVWKNPNGYYSLDVLFDFLVLPFNCNYVTGCSFTGDNCSYYKATSKSGSGLKGESITYYPAFYGPIKTTIASSFSSFSGQCWADCVPYTGVPGDYFDIDICFCCSLSAFLCAVSVSACSSVCYPPRADSIGSIVN